MLLDPTPEDLIMREILRDASGDRATKKMAQRKLDSVGYITAHAEFASSPAKMKRMKQALELAKSLAEIARIDAAEDKAKKDELDKELLEVAPDAVKKWYAKGKDFSKITIKEQRAIAHKYYKVILSNSQKPKLVKEMIALHNDRPDMMPTPSNDNDDDGN